VFYAWFLAVMGRKDEAAAEAKRSQQADALSSLANFVVGSVSVFTRHWDPAIEQLRSAKELDPNFWFDPCFLGRAYEQKGMLPEAIGEFQRAVELEKDNSETWSGLGHAYALSGNRTEAQKGSFTRVIGAHLRRFLQRGNHLRRPGRKGSGIRVAGSGLQRSFLLSGRLSANGRASGQPALRPTLR
jgi:tetratricopeptide (TPR) repeat protein